MGEEKRKEKRYAVEIKLDYRLEGSFITNYTANISCSGLFVCTAHPYDVAEQLRLRLQCPGEEAPFAFNAIVRWNRTSQDCEDVSRLGMGLEFIDLSEDVIQRLGRLVSHYESDGETQQSET